MAKSTAKISRKTRQAIYARDGWRCVYCAATHTEAVLSLDHIVAHSRGGDETSPRNLVTACMDCNRAKNAKSLRRWAQEISGEVSASTVRGRVYAAAARPLPMVA